MRRDPSTFEFLPDDKINEFSEEIRKLALKMFGTDDCGDLRVNVIIIDRTRFWPMHFFPIPYDHKLTTDEQREENLRLRLTNLSIATEDVERELKLRRIK